MGLKHQFTVLGFNYSYTGEFMKRMLKKSFFLVAICSLASYSAFAAKGGKGKLKGSQSDAEETIISGDGCQALAHLRNVYN